MKLIEGENRDTSTSGYKTLTIKDIWATVQIWRRKCQIRHRARFCYVEMYPGWTQVDHHSGGRFGKIQYGCILPESILTFEPLCLGQILKKEVFSSK